MEQKCPTCINVISKKGEPLYCNKWKKEVSSEESCIEHTFKLVFDEVLEYTDDTAD